MVKWLLFQGETKHLLCLEGLKLAGQILYIQEFQKSWLMTQNQWSWVLSKCRKTQMTEESWSASVMKGCN